MNVLLDPNVAYVLLVVGTVLALLAIITPGTGIPEVLAVFCIVLAGYAVYHLSFNWWALGLIVLSTLPFFYSIRRPGRGWWLALSIIGLAAGSIFFFPSTTGLISVNPVLAVLTTALFGAFLWLAASKVLEISATRPIHELSALIGQTGEAKTAVADAGSVQVAGELWSARSSERMPAGTPIKVVGREGFVLIVERSVKE
jgi:membrane-bound serine protease (ClpP class)